MILMSNNTTITEYFDGISMESVRFYLEMWGDRCWMDLHPADLDAPETWTITEAKLYDLATTKDSMAQSIKEGCQDDINMNDSVNMMILKNIKDSINKHGNIYKGLSWYGDDYSEFTIEDTEGYIYYQGELICHKTHHDNCNEDNDCDECPYKGVR
jgi:hypothetical protein